MNAADILMWVSPALAAASIIYTIISSRSKKHDERFEKIEIKQAGLSGKIDTVEDRVVSIESDLKHLPDKEVTHRLERSILEMRAEMRGLAEQVKPIAHMASRMQDALLEKVVGQ